MRSSRPSDRELIRAKIAHHNKAKVQAALLAKKYLASHDFGEAARWADVARSHRFVVEVLEEIFPTK